MLAYPGNEGVRIRVDRRVLAMQEAPVDVLLWDVNGSTPAHRLEVAKGINPIRQPETVGARRGQGL